MKKYILIFILLPGSFLFVVGQNVFTLDGTSGTRAYSHIDSALKYAEDGDYLYLPGGTISTPGNLIFKKRLNVIGTGHYPDSTSATGITIINSNVVFLTESSGSMLQGVFIVGSMYLGNAANNGAVKNLLISRCSFITMHLSPDGVNNSGAEHILIRENIVRGDIALSVSRNVLVENSVIHGGILYGGGQTIVRNCIMLRTSGNAVVASNGTRFENNIFLTSGGFWAGNNYNIQFYNNVFRETDPIGASPMHLNNKFSITNLFVGAPEGGFSYTGNYRLKSDSPAKNAGFDGKDCGIYGGANPYKDGALPVNPHIRAKVLPAQTDAQGKINVQVTVAAQNN
jgi:hypothetical protein